MKTRQQKFILIAASLLMLILIFDSKTALTTAQEGLELCIKTVIPSLFPMIILSSILTNSINELASLAWNPIERFLVLPQGGLGIYLSGLLGGYPIGAKCAEESYRRGTISKSQAENLLQFMNNAGPSFIFGICSLMFSSAGTTWSIWLVQILSSIFTCILLKGNTDDEPNNIFKKSAQKVDLLHSSLRAMAGICAWVILFRVLLGFLNRWILWLMPPAMQVLACGLFELTNGACMLAAIPDESVRYVICCVLLSFGGFCVIMQTKSVTPGLSIVPYLKGKSFQTITSASISILLSAAIFPDMYFSRHNYWIIASTVVLIILILRKLGVDFLKNMVYNPFRNQKKGYMYAVSKEN